MEPQQSDEPKELENGSDWEGGNDHVMEIFKDGDLYAAARTGRLEDFGRILDQVSGDALSRRSPAGNTYLHVAAKHRHEDIVAFIAAEKPSLVLSRNVNGETALHLAAKAGNASMVRALILIRRDPRASIKDLLRVKNCRGNTALHEALINGQDSIAEYLIGEDVELSYALNKEGDSALYLAAKAGFGKCVSLIIRLSKERKGMKVQFAKVSPIQAAIQGNQKDVLEAMFEELNPSFVQWRDKEGRNPLHLAALLGHVEGVRTFLNRHPDAATERDKSGALPVHLASIEGHVDVVRVLLQDCPDPCELLDRDGCSILHVAAKNGRANVVNFVLKNRDLSELINMADNDGNTALHLAARSHRSVIVTALVWDGRVSVRTVNARGLSALDVATYSFQDSSLSQATQYWWTRAVLRAAGAPRSGSIPMPLTKEHISVFKERINFGLLVAILVATVTFAAGFTVPGGYKTTDDKSSPLSMTKLSFYIYVLSNAISMYTSVSAAVLFIWTLTLDFVRLVKALYVCACLLVVAVASMSVTFSAGVFLVVSNTLWLRTVVLVLGLSCHTYWTFYILLIFIPLFSTIQDAYIPA